jgi:spore maturation protein CgeB
LGDVIKKIQYYQNHEEELEKIAQNGYNFAQEKLSGEQVAEIFFRDIQQLNRVYQEN